MPLVRLRRGVLVTLVLTVFAGVMTDTSAVAGVPGSTSAINVDAHGLALGGYDPVAYALRHGAQFYPHGSDKERLPRIATQDLGNDFARMSSHECRLGDANDRNAFPQRFI